MAAPGRGGPDALAVFGGVCNLGVVARNRTRLFGRRPACRPPDATPAGRFIEDEPPA